MSDPRPYFQPDGKAHRALMALSDVRESYVNQLRVAAGINPRSTNACRKFFYALVCLEHNGHVERIQRARDYAFAITDSGRALLARLNLGESVYGEQPPAARPSARVFGRAA